MGPDSFVLGGCGGLSEVNSLCDGSFWFFHFILGLGISLVQVIRIAPVLCLECPS